MECCSAIRSRSGAVRMRNSGPSPPSRVRLGWLASGLCAALAETATFVPAPATAMSTPEQQYEAALRLQPRPDHGAQLFELCSTCHGRDGHGSRDGTVPAIAGQVAPVLVRQLIEFRDDRRHSIRVQGFMAHHQLSLQNLSDVAAYVSGLSPRQPSLSRETPRSVRGAALFQNLCARCHGSHAQGDPDARVPRLAAQHSAYLAEQLRDAAEGRRPSMEHDHARLLARLSVDDLNALAEYLAGVAPSANRPVGLDEPEPNVP